MVLSQTLGHYYGTNLHEGVCEISRDNIEKCSVRVRQVPGLDDVYFELGARLQVVHLLTVSTSITRATDNRFISRCGI